MFRTFDKSLASSENLLWAASVMTWNIRGGHLHFDWCQVPVETAEKTYEFLGEPAANAVNSDTITPEEDRVRPKAIGYRWVIAKKFQFHLSVR